MVVLGQWRSSVRTRVLTIFVVVGVLVGLPGYWLVRELQFQSLGYAITWLSAVGFAVPAVGFGLAGKWVAGLILARRTPAKLTEVAANLKVPRDQLDDLAKMLI